MDTPNKSELNEQAPAKAGIAKTLFSKEGWKKDLKKLKWLVAILILVAIIFGISRVLKQDFLGWRLDAKLTKINSRQYSHIAPDFSFQYPDYFQTDQDLEKKYGDNYLAGFKLKSDMRTGCDVRTAPAGINFKKSDQEIQAALAKELSQNAKDFKMLGSGRLKVGGEDAFQANFSFTDPIGSTVRLSQVMVSHAGSSYLLVCGTGDYQYQFVSRDFDNFFKTFNWKSGLAMK